GHLFVRMRRAEAVLRRERAVAGGSRPLVGGEIDDGIDAIEQAAPEFFCHFLADRALLLGRQFGEEAAHDDASELDVAGLIAENEPARLADRGEARVFIARLEQLARSEEHTSELQSRENLVCRV